MSEAEKHSYSSGTTAVGMNTSANSTFRQHNNHVPASSEGNYNSNTTRPIFILKFNNGVPMGRLSVKLIQLDEIS